MSQANGTDIGGQINFETNKMLAEHIGNLVIGQMSAAAQAKVFSEQAQQMQALNQDLRNRIMEFETDVANLKSQVTETQLTRSGPLDEA
jgi:uncharacterized protein YceH (UPF0502 family)